MVNSITKQELHEKLKEISASARVMGSEGIVQDIDELVARIEKDLKD